MKKWKLINFCEFDKYAIQSYCVVHNVDESLNLGDITKVDEKEITDFDLMTWGFPCQDISIAGEQKGFVDEKGNQTRSGMYYEGLRILKEKKPKISIIENVKNLTSYKFKTEFETLLKDLDECNYNTYWKVLNAKDYKIPQNRERIFLVSIRKDIDNGKFKFPNGFKLIIKLKDILETNVDEKYYINKPYELVKEKTEVESNCKRIANVELNGHDYLKRVYDTDYCSPTLPTGTGGNHEPKILEDFYSNRDVREYKDYSPTLRADRFGLKVTDNPDKRVRKLTPTEYWRLMGFTDDDIKKCIDIGISNSQLYKQAGNSIVVDVLYYIFKEIYIAMPDIFNDLKVSSFFSGIGSFEKALDRFYKELS